MTLPRRAGEEALRAACDYDPKDDRRGAHEFRITCREAVGRLESRLGRGPGADGPVHGRVAGFVLHP
jgi:hypothetical protein